MSDRSSSGKNDRSPHPELGNAVTWIMTEQAAGRKVTAEAAQARFPALAAEMGELLRRLNIIEAARRLALEENNQRAPLLVPSPDSIVDVPCNERSESRAPGGATLPARMGQYELLNEVARGGMGVVYRARDTVSGAIVALKQFQPGRSISREERNRFALEAQMASRLAHAGIVRVVEFGEHAGQPFYVMEFVVGESLDQLRRRKRITPTQAADLIAKACDAIDFAHQHQIIHRDIKPSNIVVDYEGRVRVLDFGLAKAYDDDSSLTHTGQILGTPSYMAPEQALALKESVGIGSDVYALGATLYFLLTGRPPFAAGSAGATLLHVVSRPPLPPRQFNPLVDKRLEAICLKCLEKDPAQRYSSAAELGATLRVYSEELTGQATDIPEPVAIVPTPERASPRTSVEAAMQADVSHARSPNGAVWVGLAAGGLACLAFFLIGASVPWEDKPFELAVVLAENEEWEEFEEPPTELELIPEMAEATVSDVPTDLTTNPEAVEPTEVVTPFADAAPIPALDLMEFSDRVAPQNDLKREIGASSGTWFEGRVSANREGILATHGGNQFSERAVAASLNWLSAHQNYDGSWSFDHRKGGNCQGQCGGHGSLADNCKNGATGLALLPFLGAGQSHFDGKYKETVKRGLWYLSHSMKPANGGGSLMDGDGLSGMYAHGICSIALCEAYGMTQDRNLQPYAQAAVDFIVYAQDPQGGGWRYQPRTPGDMSVTSWQILALKSAHNAYLSVPPATVASGINFMNSVQSENGAYYGYTTASRGSATTAAGLLCRMNLGWKRDNPALETGIRYLAQQGPNLRGNMYYNHYATQALFHFGGPEWKEWNAKMRDHLVDTQATAGHAAGSWYFAGDGDAGKKSGGRLYFTALAALTLEVYCRHRSLYENRPALINP